MNIVPAINARDFDEAQKMIRSAAGFLPEGGWIHIDVADGTMTPNITWGNAEEFKALAKEYKTLMELSIEVHIMARDWKPRAEEWRAAGAERIIVPASLLAPRECDMDIMPSLGPEDVTEEFELFSGIAGQFQILAVSPGSAGQKFNNHAFFAVSFVRERAPGAILEVDGGITPAITRKLKEEGVDYAVSHSYIFNSANPIDAYTELDG